MAVQLINIGQVANDGTGDDLREAFVKVNANFEELDLLAEKSTVSNLGLGTGIFDSIVNYDIKLKSIAGGDSISVSADSTGTITIDSDIKNINYTTVEGDAYADHQYKFDRGRLLYSNMVQTVNDLPDASAHKGMFAVVYDTGAAYFSQANLWRQIAKIDDVNLKLQKIVEDEFPTLGNSLNANNNDITAVNNLSAVTITGNVTGNVTGLVNGVDPATADAYFDNYWDFGGLSYTPANLLAWFAQAIAVDMGTLSVPEQRAIELGGFTG